jgi:hypothetical protein
MFWLNPLALVALAAVAAPLLIHLLVHRHAEHFPFPTLRFLRPTRLAAIRRHLLDDLPLLAVRAALIAVAAAALAGPLIVTTARRHAWDRRIARATVMDIAGTEPAPASPAAPARFADAPEAQRPRPADADQGRPLQRTFEAADMADGIRRAILWLETAPPARREIVIESSFPIGSITPADVAAIPAGIGVRFERRGTLPAERTVTAGRVLTSTGARARDLTLTRDQTVVRDHTPGDPVAWPVDVVSSVDDRPAIDAAIAAVLSQHVWAAPPERRARVLLVGPVASVDLKVGTAAGNPTGTTSADAIGTDSGVPQTVVEALSGASAIDRVWMADAIARAARDSDLRAAGAQVSAGLEDARFSSPPWQTLTFATDGRPLAAAARSSDRLLIVSAAPAADLATPLLLRSIANAIADVPDLHRAEVAPIVDAVLQQWSRPAARLISPRLETVDQDDRRWLWAAALALLVLETWVRRARSADVPHAGQGEQTRVA